MKLDYDDLRSAVSKCIKSGVVKEARPERSNDAVAEWPDKTKLKYFDWESLAKRLIKHMESNGV